MGPAMRSLLLLLSLAAAAFSAAVVPPVAVEDNEVGVEGRGASGGGDGAGWRLAVKVLADCTERGDLVSCLGVKTAAALGRAARMSDIKLADGVSFVRTGAAEDRDGGRALASEADMQNAIDSQEPASRSDRLVDLLMEAAGRFLRTHSLQFKLPDEIPGQIQRALQDEGRGKKKKLLKALLPILLGVGAKMLLLVPLGLLVVGVLAFKALIVSKIALVLGAVLAVQKFLRGGSGGSGGGWAGAGASGGGWSSAPAAVGSGWSAGGASSGPGAAPGGWGRSLEGDAQEMAYSAHAPRPHQD
ncbi:uncharacterized protein LOC126355094 [Schistocerca gregaria]|uniref:uncharacterized protein LOC126355094 n=1 Tax=Schistocerca gregaria TaxID=7010 RepID=UPI00211E1E36|nr:uncharacterized protein LOC126355094 [Schistocerca gregaria]